MTKELSHSFDGKWGREIRRAEGEKKIAAPAPPAQPDGEQEQWTSDGCGLFRNGAWVTSTAVPEVAAFLARRLNERAAAAPSDTVAPKCSACGHGDGVDENGVCRNRDYDPNITSCLCHGCICKCEFAEPVTTTAARVPQPTAGADGRYCMHHDDDPAHGKECYDKCDATALMVAEAMSYCGPLREFNGGTTTYIFGFDMTKAIAILSKHFPTAAIEAGGDERPRFATRSTALELQGRCDHGEVLTASCDDCAARSPEGEGK